MMHILQAAPLEAGKEVISAAKNGELDQLIEQVIKMGAEAGKSLLLAILVAIVGRYLVKFINRLVARMLVRRNVEPTVQSFLKSFTNITLLTLLIITVISTHRHTSSAVTRPGFFLPFLLIGGSSYRDSGLPPSSFALIFGLSCFPFERPSA